MKNLSEIQDVFAESLGPFVRFKGGSPSSPSVNIGRTPESLQNQATLYPWITNAMQGEGFGPSSTTALRNRDLRAGFETSFETAKSDVTSQLARTVDPRDSRVTEFAMQQLSRGYNTGKDNLRRAERAELASDKRLGMGMAVDSLASEQRMAISGAQAFNNAEIMRMSSEAQLGTMGTNIAGGLGSGITDLYFADVMAGNTRA